MCLDSCDIYSSRYISTCAQICLSLDSCDISVWREFRNADEENAADSSVRTQVNNLNYNYYISEVASKASDLLPFIFVWKTKSLAHS